MKQQINLYEIKHSESLWREWSPMPQLAVGFVLLLTAAYVWGTLERGKVEQELLAVETQHNTLQQRVEEMRAQLPPAEPKKELQNRVSGLQRQIKNKQDVLLAIGVDRIGNQTGFSQYLEGLARQTLKGLWLTQIELSEGGRNIGLQGRSAKPEYVPQLLRRLTQEPVFQGTEFDIFSIENDPEDNVLGFDVRADREEQAP